MSKKILIVGGLGYLGSTIAHKLKINDNIVHIIDCCMYRNEDIEDEIRCDKLYKISTYNIQDEIDIDNYDKIIWCSDIDIVAYYDEDIPEDKFFLKCLESKYFNYIGHFITDYETDDRRFKDFMLKRKELIINQEGIYFSCGSLYGTSIRMRCDRKIFMIFF